MRQPRSITLLFAAAGVCLLYSFAQQVSQPPLILQASQPPAIAAVPDASAAAMLSSVAQQSHSTPISPAASAAFWLPPAGTPSAARATSPVSGCAPAPGNQQAQRAPILLARGKGNPGCAAAAGAASGLQVPPDQVVACALAAAATDGELLLLSGGRPLRSLSHALTLSRSHHGGTQHGSTHCPRASRMHMCTRVSRWRRRAVARVAAAAAARGEGGRPYPGAAPRARHARTRPRALARRRLVVRADEAGERRRGGGGALARGRDAAARGLLGGAQRRRTRRLGVEGGLGLAYPDPTPTPNPTPSPDPDLDPDH